MEFAVLSLMRKGSKMKHAPMTTESAAEFHRVQSKGTLILLGNVEWDYMLNARSQFKPDSQ